MILAQGTLAYSLTSVMGAIPAEMDAMCCGEPVRHPTQKSRVGLTPGNPHAFPRIRIWRGRRVLAHAADVLGRATATSNEAPNDE